MDAIDNRPVEASHAPAPDELVKLGTADGPSLAGLWQSTLEGQGIHCVVGARGIILYSMPTFDIRVQYKDLRRAQELLGLDASTALDA